MALAVVGLPDLNPGAGRPVTSLLMFPVMVIGVALVGIALTAVTEGAGGLRALRSRLTRRRTGMWFLAVLIPPTGILLVLEAFRTFVSPQYAPQFLIYGIAAGILAGLFEELGWTGFAYPRMRSRSGALRAALLLGVLWGIWHLPVVDSLGAASPHGRYLPAFFASFLALVIALRVLIAWVYVNTGSLSLAQLLHASSTGFLVVFSPPGVSAGQEALWYLVYAALLWLVVGVVVLVYGAGLTSGPGRQPGRERAGSRTEARASDAL